MSPMTPVEVNSRRSFGIKKIGKIARLFYELVPPGDTHGVNELMWQVLFGSSVCACTRAPCQGCRVL